MNAVDDIKVERTFVVVTVSLEHALHPRALEGLQPEKTAEPFAALGSFQRRVGRIKRYEILIGEADAGIRDEEAMNRRASELAHHRLAPIAFGTDVDRGPSAR